MRTLNVRLAAILLSIIFVGGVGLYFLHYFQQKRNAEFFLDQAKLAGDEAEKAKKENKKEVEEKAIKKQLENMQKYLWFNPSDMKVSKETGMLLTDHLVDQNGVIDSNKFNLAYSLLDKVVMEDETDSEARRKLVDLNLVAGQLNSVKEHLNVLLKEKKDDPELLHLLGKCEIALGELDNAKKALEKAIDLSPHEIENYPSLASLLRYQMDKPKDAYACMQQMIDNNPDSAKAWVYFGEHLQSIDSKDEALRVSDKEFDPKEEAMNAAEKAMALAPEDMDALLLAAKSAMALGKLDKAREYAEKNMQLHKDSPQIYTILADIFYRSSEKEKALDILDKGLKENKNSPVILYTKANLLVEDKKLDEAKSAINQLRSTSFQKALLDHLEAKIVFMQRDWAEASRRFEEVRPLLNNLPRSMAAGLVKQTDMCLGVCYGQLHNVDKQIQAFRSVLAIDPFYGPARQQLTDALLANGKIDDAVDEYKKLIRTKGMSNTGLITFATLLIRQNMQKGLKDQDWTMVEKVLDEAEKQNPDAYQVSLLRTEVLHSQNRNNEAEKTLQKAHAKYPKQIEIWRAMVTLATVQKKWDQAEKILAEFQQLLGDSVELRLTRADYIFQRNEPNAGEQLKKLGENLDAFSDAEKIQLWNGLLTTARRSGDKERVKYFAELLSQKDTNNLELHFLRLEQAANNMDVAGLEDALKDIKKVEGEGALWHFGQARLLAVKSSTTNNPALLEDALQELAEAKILRPTWQRIPLFIGSIYDQQNKKDQALNNYLEAITAGERGPAAVRRTVELLLAKQRYDDADNMLQQMEREQLAFTPELTQLWVRRLLQQGKYELAATKARNVVSPQSKEYKEHLWLGQVYGVAARYAKAQKHAKEFQDFTAESEKSLRKAAELKPDAPEVWITLVELLNSVDKPSEAEEVISQIRTKVPADQAAITLGQCYELMDKNDLAMEQYKLALAAKPDDDKIICAVAAFYQRISKTIEAEALLRLIVDGKVKAEEANLQLARRQLAVILAAKGGVNNVEAARKLISDNLASAAASSDDLRIKATFDAADPRRSKKDEAIGILEGMTKGQQATPEDRFKLAMLYLGIEKQAQNRPTQESNQENGKQESKNAWLKANEILRSLITSQDANPRYLAIYAKTLLDHGETTGAEQVLNKLKKDYPDSAATFVLQAELMGRRNQYEEALDLMKSFVDKKNAIPADRSQRIKMMAETMENLNEKLTKPDQKLMAERYGRTSEMFYRQYVDEHPSQSFELVMFFYRQKRYEDALSSLEQSWRESDPSSVAHACISIFQATKDSKELVARVEQVLSDARVKFDNHPAIILTLGDLRVGQERYSEAEKYYRDVLETNKGHSVAMNNLAVLLAIQKKNLDEALSLINKAIEITGPIGSMLDTRGSVYIARGEGKKAIENMEDSVADDQNPVRLFHLAEAYNLGDQKHAAASAMQKALKAGLKKEMLPPLEWASLEKMQALTQ